SDWLYSGLRAAPARAALVALLEEEVASNHAEALSPSYRALLQSDLQVELQVRLLEVRWQAADRLKRWDIYRDDLEAFRTAIARTNEASWLRLLVALAARLAWLTPEEDGGLFNQVV